jgi:putative intracellular protease/amidase
MTTKSTKISEEQRHKDHIDGLKTFFETLKHVTTLSAGSILLLATLLEKIFKTPSWRPLIAVIFLFFAVSLIFSVFGMWSAAHFIRASGEDEVDIARLSMACAIGSLGGFLFGFVALIAFSLKNF